MQIDGAIGLIQTASLPKNNRWLELSGPTSGSSGKMLSTSLLYLGLSAPQHPQTPEEEKAKD